MSPPAPSVVDSEKGSGVFSIIGWTLAVILFSYFVITNVPRYFVFTRASYGSYYWPRAVWLFPHVLGGLVAANIGCLQFVPRLRAAYPAYHRVAGRVYVVAVLIGGVASWGVAAGIKGAPAYALGLGFLGVAWITTTLMAFVAIRRRNLVQHKQWMVRSYVVTFAFVTFRLVSDLLESLNIMPSGERDSALAWGCWAIPLLVNEVIMQSGAIFRGRPAQA